MADRWSLLDRSTQRWVRTTGRRVDIRDLPWLDGPVGVPSAIGDEWLEREAVRLHGKVADGGGLLPTFKALAGAGFDPAVLASPVVEFYEQTSDWRLDVWSQWSPLAWPFGWILSAAFARRLEQLSLPMRPLDAALGMESTVRRVLDDGGQQLGAIWMRKLRFTGQTVYSGWYGTATLPNRDRPSIRVAFPLPNGSIVVFLRPEVEKDGALRLSSPLGGFGDDGAYLVVAEAGSGIRWVRRVPIVEDFRVFVDDEGVLRTDHALSLWNIPAIRLHYRLQPGPS